MGYFPQFRIKLPPHFVGTMIPRRTHIQSKLRQGIKSLDFRGEKIVDRMADASLFAHLLIGSRKLRYSLNLKCLSLKAVLLDFPPQCRSRDIENLRSNSFIIAGIIQNSRRI